MADREALLKLLDEYNLVLETLRRESQTAEDAHNGSDRQAIADQLAYLEYRILQVETQLNLVDWNAHHLTGCQAADDQTDAPLQNSRQGDWSLWAYLAVWGLIILVALICNIFSSIWVV